MLTQWIVVFVLFVACMAVASIAYTAIERITFHIDGRRYARYWRTYGVYLCDLRIRRLSCDCLTCNPYRRIYWPDKPNVEGWTT